MEVVNMNDIKTVVAYCRYSSDSQRDGYSIEAQKKAIIEFCKRNKYKLLDFYIDEAKTGTNDNRVAFQSLISDSSKGLFSAVIVHKLDRFSRDRYNSIFYRKRLKDNGVKLISVLENIDDDNPEDLILLSVLEGMADYYSKNLSREVKKGMMAAASKGLSTGGVTPFGYQIDHTTKKYVISNDKAILIKTFFEMYAKGFNLIDLERYAKDGGWKTNRGRLWSKTYIRKVLQNEVYIGVKLYNNSKNYNKSKQSKAEPIRVEGAHEGIVSLELFNTVQARFKKEGNPLKSPRAGGNNHDYILTGLISCGLCGKNYSGMSTHKRKKESTKTNKYYYYECRGKKNTLEKKCNSRKFKQSELEEYVVQSICYALDNNNITHYSKMILNILKKESSTSKIDSGALKKDVHKLKEQQSRLLDLYLDAAIDKEKYKEKMTLFEEQIKSLENQLLHLENEYSFTLEELELAFKLMLDDLKSDITSFTNRKAIVKTFIKKILVNEDSLDVYINLPMLANNAISAPPLEQLLTS